MLNYSTKESTVYTYPILLGMKLSDFLVTTRLKNPSIPKKSLIDYDLTLILESNVLIGASVGVLVNMTLANLLIIIAFTLFLAYSCVKALMSARKLYLEMYTIKNIEKETK
jgi:uncharacterized membrane protein YfcA